MQKLKNLFHLLEALTANCYYRFPSRQLKIIGITGTDGKTTTTHLIYHILITAGKKTSMISSIGAVITDKLYDTGFHITTPSSFAIQKYLRRAVNHDEEFFVLETTSHALDQNRVFGINYYLSVLTNITHEHLDYHQSYDEYLRTKTRLLIMSKVALVNSDDSSYQKVLELIKNEKIKINTYSFKSGSDFTWNDVIKTNLQGKFNQYNILAAYAVGKILGIKEEKILQAIETFQLPKGRLDIVYDQDFKVIIDFAHTPNALEQLLSTVKQEILSEAEGRLIHIFGAAGLRDSSKRPKMGNISGKYADIIILTEEDYRTENVEEICRQIGQGLKKKGLKKLVIINRLDAIQQGISLAKKGDVVVITGKGHEKSLCRGKIEYTWNEYAEVKQALSRKFKK